MIVSHTYMTFSLTARFGLQQGVVILASLESVRKETSDYLVN